MRKMTDSWRLKLPNEDALRLIGEILALKLRPGDMVTLRGDLGAGKTSLARHIIRALADDLSLEVPSPTFTIVQSYEETRIPVYHFDLYRIAAPDELTELDFDDTQQNRITLVEWPDQAGDRLARDRIDIVLEETSASESERIVTITAAGTAVQAIAAAIAIHAFLIDHYSSQNPPSNVAYLQGDASTRAYARITESSGRTILLMDSPSQSDGPVVRDGRTYSEIAQLAETAVPFVAIAHALRSAELSAPQIYAFDPSAGLALIEDLGHLTFAEALAAGVSQSDLWRAGVAVLVHLRKFPPDKSVGNDVFRHDVPTYAADVLLAETELLPDWFWPFFHQQDIPLQRRAEFNGLWTDTLAKLNLKPAHWVLRDYHSPNLIWLPNRIGIRSVGVIDFQDAQRGPPGYDLVSLIQDARIGVAPDIQEQLLDDYCRAVQQSEPGFDASEFRTEFAILGAQRNTKILGIFARLSMRDGKHAYIQHMPRIWGYLERNLHHPTLSDLRTWYDQYLPAEQRRLR